MDKELMDILVNLKIDEKALTILVDTILDNCELIGYDGNNLRIISSSPIIAVIKAFRYDEYNNRLEELKAMRKAIQELIIEKGKEEG